MAFGDAKEQVRQAIDIVDLVGSYLELRRQGRNYVARCPWHDDNKPSLTVNPDRQTWKCWVCNIGGDLFSFVMKKESVEFKEALKMLADRAGIPLAQSTRRIEPGSPDDKTTLYACCEWAARQYQECLLKSDVGEVARKYLVERAISVESIERFRIGFVPDAWSWLMDRAKSTPYTPAILEACGLLSKNEVGRIYDRFRGRVMFPIRDRQRRVIAFGGRVIPGLTEGEPAKYINSPETAVFSKSKQLYGMDVAMDAVSKSRQITIVEGYTDVILCHQYGINDVVAVLGTAFNEQHIPLVRSADVVHLLLDGDEAGRRRASEILELFVAHNVDLRIVTLPDELDPAEFLEERGADQFHEVIRRSVDALDHMINLETAGIDRTRDVEPASQALNRILSVIARGAPVGTLDPSQQIRANLITRRLAREFLLEDSDVRSRLSQLRRTAKGRFFAGRQENQSLGATYSLADLSQNEVQLIQLLTQHPEVAPTALSEIGDDEFASAPCKEIFQIYRRLEESGESLAFGRILSEIENIGLKSLLVEVDEDACRRAERAKIDPATHLRAVIEYFERQHVLRQFKETELAIEQKRFNEQEEIQVWLTQINDQRRQRGIYP